MRDMDRAAINRMVYRKLADPDFRRRLTATAPDGTRPIVVGLRGDAMSAIVTQVAGVGGAANVVTPWLNGVVVYTMVADEMPPGDPAPGDAPRLGDCTLGVFLERLMTEHGDTGPATYAFAFPAPGGVASRARAELVAVAG